MEKGLSLTASFTFNSAHFLPNHKGKCRMFHGHTYRLEVTVAGSVNSDSESDEYGMLMDFHRLKELVWEVLEKYDHHDLNRFMKNPTAENIVTMVSNEIEERLPDGISLVRAVLWETPDCRVEYGGRDALL